jgi:hypothetical protein
VELSAARRGAQVPSLNSAEKASGSMANEN